MMERFHSCLLALLQKAKHDKIEFVINMVFVDIRWQQIFGIDIGGEILCQVTMVL